MFRSQILIALRTILKNKVFSLINIFGLSISMSVCLLVIMLIVDQYSSDRFNPDRNRIYRINTKTIWEGREDVFATSPIALANAISNTSTEVEKVAIVRKRFGGDVRIAEKILPLQGIYANEYFFDVLHLNLMKGDPKLALKDPYSIVLTPSSAIKLFGGMDVMGKTIGIDNNGEYTVTGILAENNNKSHISGFEAIASVSTLPILHTKGYLNDVVGDWNSYFQSYSYLLLHDKNRTKEIESFMNEVGAQHYSKDGSAQVSFSLQSLMAINPAERQLSNEFFFSMPVVIIFILSGISILIILTAAFNYTNLSLAKSITRMKEIGIRKVSGADRYQIFTQFIVESIIISLLALIVSYGLLYLLIPAFYSLDPNLSKFINFNQGPTVMIYFLGFSVMVGILGGLIPSIYLSKVKPGHILKNLTGIKFLFKFNLKKVLIVLQFSISLIFIISAIIFYNQFNYALNFDMGFDKSNVINVELQENDFEVIRTEMTKINEVRSVSASSYVLGTGILYRGYIQNPEQEDSLQIAFQTVSHNYPISLGHQMVGGTEVYSRMAENQNDCIVLNEHLSKSLGFESPIDAIGERVIFENKELIIAGITRDFYYTQIDRPVDDFAFHLSNEDLSYANISLKSDNMKNTLASLEEVWERIDGQHKFTYSFYDDQIEQTYTVYLIWTKIIGFTSFLAISIACIGLFGMAIYASESRLKEIGIRKTLGAGVFGLMLLLSRGFIKLLIIASIISIPLAWMINEQFLSGMANRTPITLLMVLKGVILMLVLGLITIGSQTYKAALANPADTLRSE